MNQEFDIKQADASFDFKGFFDRFLRSGPLFLISFLVAFSIAYYVNVRKQPVYMMENLISIKDDQNPFFTTTTSLTFNWGGTTDKVNTAVITLRSRSHNEKVVERLQFYMTYLREGKYQQIDAYKHTPFLIDVDTGAPQMLGQQFRVVFKDSVNFNLSVSFEDGRNVNLQNYHTKENSVLFIDAGTFSRDYKLGESISLPFFSGTFLPNPDVLSNPGTPYYFVFHDFNSTVKNYLKTQVAPESKGSSVLRLTAIGNNKAKLVDYLNTSVEVLSEDMLERKNLYATKTIQFIDSSLAKKSAELSSVQDELNTFRNRNEIYDLASEGTEIKTKLNGLDLRKEEIDRELSYYITLQEYLTTRSDYRDVPAPSVAGISEGSIIAGVGKIVALAEERNKLQYSFKEGAPIFNDIDRQINAVKTVLLENIRSTRKLKTQEMASIQADIAQYEAQIRKLPKEQQDLLNIERRYNLSEGTYNLFLAKRSEAGLVKAANVSDVVFIDRAKDTGGGKVGPNTQLNYMMAGLLGFFIPLFIIFGMAFFDTKVEYVKDLAKITPIPLFGVIGKNHSGNSLAVLSQPKSAIAEAFRSLRSSLQFLYKQHGVTGAKTVLFTSSVSGEGKTFCSINIASIFALSEKRTVIVDLDLRKPKISSVFSLDNSRGVVNFLINKASLEEIVQKTDVDFLDVIPSGPPPPNPSELLLGENMDHFMDLLKDRYDYIILDSPPIGLVSDALEVIKYADATLYMVRHNRTRKNMLTFVNEKYKRGEIKHISIVLNEYVEKSGRGFGYGYGYGYGYGDGSYKSYGDGYHGALEKRTFLSWIKGIFRG